MRGDLEDDAEILPAFPCGDFVNDESPFYGIRIRDYFAARAMQSILRNACALNIAGAKADWDDHSHVADFAYDVADAMLVERKK